MTCPERPPRPSNRPGLPALRYRIGEYASFRDRLISRLTCDVVTPDQPEGISLRKLKTRTSDDPAIALLDAFAVVADVLTFYQERIINEGFLLTATERRSVLELARMIGYELHPGVAASTLLAFTVEEALDSPKVAAIAKGTQILSVPEQDELPQTFETSADFTAHVEWNALKPRPARPQKILPTTRQLFLQGTSTGLQPGDTLLLMDDGDASKPYYFLTIDRVEANPANSYTLVSWKSKDLEIPPRSPCAIAFRQRANLFGFNAPRWETVSDTIKLAEGSKLNGGVSRASEGAQPLWQPVNQGLSSFEIQCLLVSPKGTLLAGTPIGVFRSTNNGESWTLANSGLTNFNIQTIYATTEHLLVGTPNGGVFRSTDDGATWSPIGIGSISVRTSNQNSEPVSTGIPNTVVRSLTSIAITFTAPTLSTAANSADGRKTIRITRGETIIPLALQPNDILIVGGQERRITAIAPTDASNPAAPIEVTIDSAFRTAPTAANPSGVERDLPAGTAFIAYRPNGTSPLFVSSSNGSFIVAATDIGVYRSADQGKNWYGSAMPDNLAVRSLVTAAGFIFAKTDRGIYRSVDRSVSWNNTNLTNTGKSIRSLVAYQNDAFAAVNDGVYRSRDGNTWVPVVAGLGTDTNVWSITINPNNGQLFAFTASGVFQSLNRGDSWTQWGDAVTQNLKTISTAAKSGAGTSSFVVVGAAFTGFEGEGEAGWRNFYLPKPQPGDSFQIDLSTTNPKLLADSWIVLRLPTHDQLCQIKAIAEVQRRDFLLDSKVARVFTDSFIEDPKQFNLRDTIVLAQSEELPLKDEPLTIPVQQTQIFFDPIWDSKVLLSKYVTGLQVEHPVILNGKRIRAELLNAGGIVQQAPDITTLDDPWSRTNSGLTNTNVVAFTAHQKNELSEIESDETAIRGDGTVFAKELKRGITLVANGQSRQVKEIYSNDSLSVETEFNPQLEQLLNFQYTGTGLGSISSKENVVTGSNTKFKQELKEGVTLVVGTERRVVTEISSDTSLKIATKFPDDLPPGTPFSYEGTGTGKIQVDRTALKGTNTHFDRDLTKEQAISFKNTTYRIQRIISGNLLFIDANVETASTPFTSSRLFVGTAGGGVFRSINNGVTWEAINQGLTTLDIQAIAVRSEEVGYQLFAGTAIGVFQTEMLNELNDAVEWTQINQNLAYPDVRSLLAIDLPLDDRTGILLAGSANGGILLLSELGWSQIALPDTDVQTLYQIPNTDGRGDIFAGTVGDRVYRGIIGDSPNGEGIRTLFWQPLSRGLEDHPNVTCFVSDRKPGLSKVTYRDTTVIGDSSIPRTTFTTEFAIGDTITIQGETRRIKRVVSDLQLEVESPFLRSNDQPQDFSVVAVWAGTPGGGIFHLEPDAAQRPTWKPVPNNPADLNVLCLTINPNISDPNTRTLFAGTASGGIFRSIDGGNLWAAMNAGLTSRNILINPAVKVNTEFRALAFVNQTLFAAGVGILISPDNLYTIPVRAGDLLEVMAPPVPLPDKGRELSETVKEQKWALRDRDGFLGTVFTADPADVKLQPAAAGDPTVSEQHVIALPPQDQQEPLLTLREPIQNSYDPQTLKIYANVVSATHGETIQEVLGNGDSTLTHQTFQLKKPPLTYVSATTPSGAETTLQVRVNEVLWQEKPSLYQKSSRDQVYITLIADDSLVTITFGDGISGARLPTGEENVTATYRSGIGLAGLVGADRLALLKTRPLGIAEVTNPLPATGAANPESMNEARISAPLTVRTLDRIVSLQDYEDFARAFAGIGKAQADLLSTGEAQLVHITVAALEGRDVPPDSALYTKLVQAIDAARDPVQQVRVTSFESIGFNVAAKLLIDPRYLSDLVIAAAKAALLNCFTFEHRRFGQAATAAEVIATLQAVEGIIAVDLDAFHRRDRTRSLEQSVPALSARWQPATREILPAQLLGINPAGIRLQGEAAL